MSTSIQELYSELEVDPNTPSEEGIDRLKDYFQDSISRDCFFEGSLGNRFNSYLDITKQYIELVWTQLCCEIDPLFSLYQTALLK